MARHRKSKRNLLLDFGRVAPLIPKPRSTLMLFLPQQVCMNRRSYLPKRDSTKSSVNSSAITSGFNPPIPITQFSISSNRLTKPPQISANGTEQSSNARSSIRFQSDVCVANTSYEHLISDAQSPIPYTLIPNPYTLEPRCVRLKFGSTPKLVGRGLIHPGRTVRRL